MCGQVEKTPDANGHGQAGVFNNHTGVADFEEDGSSGGPAAFYKGKAIFDQNLIKSSAPFTALLLFSIYFHGAPCVVQV